MIKSFHLILIHQFQQIQYKEINLNQLLLLLSYEANMDQNNLLQRI